MGLEVLNDEEGRLAALHRHGLSGPVSSEAMHNIVSHALAAFEIPVSAISLLDRTTQNFLSTHGMEASPRDRKGTPAERVIETGDVVVIADGVVDPQREDMRAYLGVPLVSPEGYCLGVLEVMDRVPRVFSEAEITMARDLARLAVNCLAIGQPEDFDSLTGAFNRRRFQAELGREFLRARRYDRPASLIFFDVDRFAQINAELGLATGDQIIRALANRTIEMLRGSDVFGRIGGEAFGVLLPETLAYEASQCAERLREEIARLRFRNDKGIFSVTASFGIAPLRPPIASAVEWFAQADIALYGAKTSGRDCVAFAPTATEPAAPAPAENGERPRTRPLH